MSTPVKKIQYGSVSLAVFEKDSEKFGKQQSYAISRNYKDKNDKWVKNVIYLNNTADIVNTIQACQDLLDYKYFKDAGAVEPKQEDDCPI
jgi:hypothetical protein